MGRHSYICPICKGNIRIGESAVLFHVRHGEILGKDLGWYDGYGRVRLKSEFAGTNGSINSHEEIIISKYKLEDSGVKSGVSAIHIHCYKKALKKNKNFLNELPISEGDDKQGIGIPRNKCSSIQEYVEFMKEWEK